MSTKQKKVLTVMVNNSTNVNKTITSRLNSLNIKKKTMTYDVGNQDPGLEQAQNLSP